MEILQAEERVLGVAGTRARTVTRTPHRLWWDVEPGGALFHAVKVFLECKREGKLRNFGTTDRGCEEFCEFIDRVQTELREVGFMDFVKIYVPDDVKHAAELKQMAREMRAVLATSPSDEGITHVLKEDDSLEQAADEAAFWRIAQTSTVETTTARPEHRLHYWFYPDSYDTWYADSSVVGSGKAPWGKSNSRLASSSSVKQVRARWLRDSYKFNEWMNEFDYEYDIVESMLQQTQPWEGDPVPNSDSTDFNWESMVATLPPDAEILTPTGTERLPRRVTKRRLAHVHPLIVAAALQDDGTMVEGDDVTKELIIAKQLKIENLSTGQLPIGAIPTRADRAQPSTSLSEYRVPMHSAWFKWDEAHEIEKQALPDFFDYSEDAKTPANYVDYRNAMMHAFRDAGRNVTFDEARHSLKGDKTALLRIFRFLEHWKLLNWRFAVERDSVKLKHPQPMSYGRVAVSGDRSVTVSVLPINDALKAPLFTFEEVSATTPTGAHPLDPFDESMNADAPFERRSLDRLFATHKALYTGGAEIDFACNACGSDLTRGIFYHCMEVDNFDLCAECFARGIYPEGRNSGDFVKALYPNFRKIAADANANANASDELWTDAEVMALLEAVDQYGDNWGAVAETVGTKSEEDCVKYFLKMPIDSDIVASLQRTLLVPNGVKIGITSAELPTASAVPFAGAENPVLAQLAFLTTMISPRVAAASAKAALHEIAASGNAGVDAEHVKLASTVGLAAAALQAKILASDEEHEINRIMSGIIDVQTRKLELKMRCLTAIDDTIQRDKETTATTRLHLYNDRLAMVRSKKDAVSRLPALEAQLASVKARAGVEET